MALERKKAVLECGLSGNSRPPPDRSRRCYVAGVSVLLKAQQQKPCYAVFAESAWKEAAAAVTAAEEEASVGRRNSRVHNQGLPFAGLASHHSLHALQRLPSVSAFSASEPKSLRWECELRKPRRLETLQKQRRESVRLQQKALFISSPWHVRKSHSAQISRRLLCLFRPLPNGGAKVATGRSRPRDERRETLFLRSKSSSPKNPSLFCLQSFSPVCARMPATP